MPIQETQNSVITFQKLAHLPQIPLTVSHDENLPEETQTIVPYFFKDKNKKPQM